MLFKSLFMVADLTLFHPKVVFTEAIDEVSVKVATKGICRDCFPQSLSSFVSTMRFISSRTVSRTLLSKSNIRLSIITFISVGFMTCAIADAGRVRHLGGYSLLDKSGV